MSLWNFIFGIGKKYQSECIDEEGRTCLDRNKDKMVWSSMFCCNYCEGVHRGFYKYGEKED
jgi:hypothetical protein